MFNPQSQTAVLTNVNVRIEKHGKERKLAADFKLSMKIPSDDLNEIEPGLRESLFRTPQSGDQLQLVDENAARFTVLKHPLLEPQVLKQKFPGYELTIAPPGTEGDAEGENLFLPDVELKKFTIEPHDGGSCTVSVTASAQIDRDDAAWALGFLVDGDVLLTLTPPKLQAQSDPDADEQEHDEAA